MTDIVPPAVRSRMMAGIRGSHTRPELAVRHELHRRGYRYRLHGRDLPGRPDIVLPRWQAVIFVHGCFWHGHDCALFRLPGTRTGFWQDKIARNRERDADHLAALTALGWRTAVVWECALRGRGALGLTPVADALEAWLHAPPTMPG
ncbi:very short patch repair endonuclease [Amphibiibacter pelophylacis]|uniref:Very short patch repair endonuclease n=1 Tax=Amphibiibacter pelophylacis TaxID=1799477 RepID=A0ACC6P4X4_9BURK